VAVSRDEIHLNQPKITLLRTTGGPLGLSETVKSVHSSCVRLTAKRLAGSTRRPDPNTTVVVRFGRTIEGTRMPAAPTAAQPNKSRRVKSAMIHLR
jgi:hypothetical protein